MGTKRSSFRDGAAYCERFVELAESLMATGWFQIRKDCFWITMVQNLDLPEYNWIRVSLLDPVKTSKMDAETVVSAIEMVDATKKDMVASAFVAIPAK